MGFLKNKNRNGSKLGSGFSHTQPELDLYTYIIKKKKKIKPYTSINTLFHSFHNSFSKALNHLLSLSQALKISATLSLSLYQVLITGHPFSLSSSHRRPPSRP